MKRSVTVILVLLLLGASVAAQPHGTGLLVSDDQGQILRVGPSGGVTTVGKFAYGFLNMLAMDSDNRCVVAAHSPLFANAQVLRVDLVTRAVLATVWDGAPLPSPLTWIDVDQDGDYLVMGGGIFTPGIFLHVKRDGSAIRTLFGGSTLNLLSSFTEDRASGDWILGDLGNVGRIVRVNRDTGAPTHVIGLPASGQHAYGMAQDPHRADIYVTRAGETTKYDPLTNRVSRLSATAGECIAVDRSPGPNGALLYVARSGFPSLGTLERLDRQGVNLGVVATTASAPMGMTFDRSRNLGPELRTAPNHRIIRVSFPGDAGKPYVLALGLSGYTPGVSLPDGRVIPLNPDHLTLFTASRAVPPLLVGNIGVLDSNGEAVVTFNLNPLGAAVRRVRVWAVALTLDSNAPFGISQISRARLFVL